MGNDSRRKPSSDNMLFGILALQMDFINRDALIAAMNAWALAKEKPLGAILIEHGHLSGSKKGIEKGTIC